MQSVLEELFVSLKQPESAAEAAVSANSNRARKCVATTFLPLRVAIYDDAGAYN
jgi:hypothetical protein